jgi:hypothetical protein
MNTPPATVPATRTLAPASTHVLRFTWSSETVRLHRPLRARPTQHGPPEEGCEHDPLRGTRSASNGLGVLRRPQRRRVTRGSGCSCRSPSKATDGRPLRLARVHRRLQQRRARPEGGVVHRGARERRVGELRHSMGADALGPGQPCLLLGRRELLARGVPRRRQAPTRLESTLKCGRVRVDSARPVSIAPVGGLHGVGEVRDAVTSYAPGVRDSLCQWRRPRRT